VVTSIAVGVETCASPEGRERWFQLHIGNSTAFPHPAKVMQIPLGALGGVSRLEVMRGIFEVLKQQIVEEELMK